MWERGREREGEEERKRERIREGGSEREGERKRKRECVSEKERGDRERGRGKVVHCQIYDVCVIEKE